MGGKKGKKINSTTWTRLKWCGRLKWGLSGGPRAEGAVGSSCFPPSHGSDGIVNCHYSCWGKRNVIKSFKKREVNSEDFENPFQLFQDEKGYFCCEMQHHFKCVLSDSLSSKISFQVKAKIIFLGFFF